MPPTVAEDWIAVANARARDAQSVVEGAPESVGCVYLAGYAVECSLKAYLQRQGIAFPTSGSAGHHLQDLWSRCGWPLRSLEDPNGVKAYYIGRWTTDLRYEEQLPPDGPGDGAALVAGARQLAGWIQTRVRRPRRGRG